MVNIAGAPRSAASAYWSGLAWDAIGPEWSWMDATDRVGRRAVASAVLGRAWEERLRRVPERVLSHQAHVLVREQFGAIAAEIATARPGTEATTHRPAIGAGYEKVIDAADGYADAFWFLDQGCAAWIAVLSASQLDGLLPSDPGVREIHQVLSVWRERETGARNARTLLASPPLNDARTHPQAALLHAPLAIWGARDAEQGFHLLDHAWSRMDAEEAAALGCTLPITYALLHALSGDIARAADVLRDAVHSAERPSARAEMLYQRARYLWAMSREVETADVLTGVLRADPAYVLRLLTDASWRTTQRRSVEPLDEVIASVVQDARADLTRWQQGRHAGDEELTAVRRVQDAIAFSGDEPYLVVAAAALVPAARDAWQRSAGAMSQRLNDLLVRISSFASELPAGLALRIGPSYQRRFTGTEHSDTAMLDRLIQGKQWRAADLLATALSRDVPHAARLATLEAVERLARAMGATATALAPSDAATDRERSTLAFGRRLRAIEGAERCATLVERIGALPPELGRALEVELVAIWRELADIEQEWVESEHEAIGTLLVRVPSEPIIVERHGWIAVPITVRQQDGAPVVGTPVVWRVASGPGRPKDTSDCLDEEWAMTLERGVAYLTLAAGDGPEQTGTLDIAPLGGDTVSVPYAISES